MSRLLVKMERTRSLLKVDHVRPVLKTFHQHQHRTANIRILTESLRMGALEPLALYYYLAYTIKVGEMADRYNWQSILQYDRVYRIQQATYGFRWGSDSPHLTTVHMRDKQRSEVVHINGKFWLKVTFWPQLRS